MVKWDKVEVYFLHANFIRRGIMVDLRRAAEHVFHCSNKIKRSLEKNDILGIEISTTTVDARPKSGKRDK